MRILLFGLVVSLVIACNAKEKLSGAEVKEKLQGAWTNGLTQNATFNIKKDSIFYFDQLRSYKYDVSEDTLKIFYPDVTFSGIVNFDKDTMFIRSEYRPAKFWRYKEGGH